MTDIWLLLLDLNRGGFEIGGGNLIGGFALENFFKKLIHPFFIRLASRGMPTIQAIKLNM